MLKSFKVKMLVLSAIPNLVDAWTSGFGFKPIEDDEKRWLDQVNLMLFPGTSLLLKRLDEVSAEASGVDLYPYSTLWFFYIFLFSYACFLFNLELIQMINVS